LSKKKQTLTVKHNNKGHQLLREKRTLKPTTEPLTP